MAKSMRLVSEAKSAEPAPKARASRVKFKMSAPADMTYNYTTYWQHQACILFGQKTRTRTLESASYPVRAQRKHDSFICRCRFNSGEWTDRDQCRQ